MKRGRRLRGREGEEEGERDSASPICARGLCRGGQRCDHSRANSAHKRQSRPDDDLALLETFEIVPSLLGSSCIQWYKPYIA